MSCWRLNRRFGKLQVKYLKIKIDSIFKIFLGFKTPVY